MKRFLVALVLMGALVTGVVLRGAQPFSTEVQLAINQLVTGVVPFTAFRTAASSYLNWGTTQGTSGYGFRDNAGAIQVKDSGGSWSNVQTSASTITAAPFITRTLDGNLSNEFALGSLATAILINTTTTGTPTAYAGTGACGANTFITALSAIGGATCTAVAASGLSGTVTVAAGGTALASGTSGGVLGFTGAATLASSVALTANQLVLGGGAGATPIPLGSLGTTTTVLHGNAGGAPTFAAVSLTADVSGILAVANGGTNNAYFTVAGPAASAKTYTFPNATATVLTDNAAVTAAQGGTGLQSYTTGDLIQASGPTAISALNAVATGNALISGGVSTVSAWGKIGLTTHVSGTLPVANGGTGLASYTVGQILYASGATTIAGLSDVAVNQVLVSGGVGVAPAYSAAPTLTSATLTSFVAAGTTPASSGSIRIGNNEAINANSAAAVARSVFVMSAANDMNYGDVAVVTRLRTSMNVPGTLTNGDWWVESDSGAPTGTIGLLKARLNGSTVTVASSAVAGQAVAGVAAGYKLARASGALDGGNPTDFATGLASIVSCTVTLRGTAAPGVGTSILTTGVTGATLSVYAWKVTGAGDTTLIASTGTETVDVICIGT